MKLCPQCAFVYEDHQKVCDMDGNVLVHDPASALPEPKTVPPTRLTINLPVDGKSLPAKTSSKHSPAKSKSKRSPVLLILLLVLISLLSVLAIAQVRRSRSNQAVQSPPPARSAALDNAAQPEPAALATSTSVEVAAVSEEMPGAPEEVDSTIAADTLPLKRARLSSSPVAAGASTASPRSVVVVRLRNGAAISADEAWETKEGFWYRQAGMVTFLKRSQVSAIERTTPARAPQKVAAGTGEQRNPTSDNRTAQNQLRLRRLEPVEKKPSRVRSFLKLTGRILKKPFK